MGAWWCRHEAGAAALACFVYRAVVAQLDDPVMPTHKHGIILDMSVVRPAMRGSGGPDRAKGVLTGSIARKVKWSMLISWPLEQHSDPANQRQPTDPPQPKGAGWCVPAGASL